MTQILLTIEDPKDVTLIKKLVAKMDGIYISKPKRKSRYEESCEDLEAGRVTKWNSTQEMFDSLGIKI